MYKSISGATKTIAVSCALFFAVAAFWPAMVSAASQNKPMTNADVVKLVQVGLGEDLVVAKINQARTVAFNTDVDELLRLKKLGVKEKVITAMVDRSASASSSDSAVRLLTQNGEIVLESISGRTSSTFAYVTHLVFADYPGAKADVRITDRKPTIEITSDKNPTGRYYIVKADSNKEGTRSVKLGQGGFFKGSSTNAPDNDWTFSFETKERSPGIWEAALKEPLEPGEYGVWSGGAFYGFGID